MFIIYRCCLIKFKMFHLANSRKNNNKQTVKSVSKSNNDELNSYLFDFQINNKNILNFNIEYQDILTKNKNFEYLIEIENINKVIYSLKNKIIINSVNGTIEQIKSEIQIQEKNKKLLEDKIYELSKNYFDINNQFDLSYKKIKEILPINIIPPKKYNNHEDEKYNNQDDEKYNNSDDEKYNSEEDLLKNLSSKDIELDKKKFILENKLEKIINVYVNCKNINYIPIPSPLLTILPSKEDFIEHITGEINNIKNSLNKEKTIYEIILEGIKNKNTNFSKKEYKNSIKIFKEISPVIDEQLANNQYKEIDLNIQTQTFLNKHKHALSNIKRDGTPLSNNQDRIDLANRYKEFMINNSKKLSKFTGIDFFINSIKSADKSEEYKNIIQIKYNEFSKNISDKIEIKPASIQVFWSIDQYNREVGQISNITSFDKSTQLIALIASIVETNLFNGSQIELLNREESIFDLFNKLQKGNFNNNGTMIANKIIKYIEITILNILNNNLSSYEFPPIVIFTDNYQYINYEKINSFKNDLVKVLLKDMVIPDLYIVIYNIGGPTDDNKQNMLQINGWSEINFITMFKKIHKKENDIIKIEINPEEPKEISINKEENNILQNMFNNPISLMIDKLLME